MKDYKAPTENMANTALKDAFGKIIKRRANPNIDGSASQAKIRKKN